jgi:hypothetical protein
MMDVETETLALSVTKQAADLLREATERCNGSVHNVADKALRDGLTGGVTEEMRPLETAPKDGTYFLMVGGNFDGGAAVVQWNGDWWTLDDGKNPEIALRHESGLIGWLPLPEAIALAMSNASRGG